MHDVGKLGQILDKVVTLGANDVNSIEFGVAEPEALKDEARKLAMRNAIANAKLYAEAAGAKLGKVLTISEDQGIIVARSHGACSHGDGRQGRSHRGRNRHGRGPRQRHFRAGIGAPARRRDMIQIKAEPGSRQVVLSS